MEPFGLDLPRGATGRTPPQVSSKNGDVTWMVPGAPINSWVALGSSNQCKCTYVCFIDETLSDLTHKYYCENYSLKMQCVILL